MRRIHYDIQVIIHYDAGINRYGEKGFISRRSDYVTLVVDQSCTVWGIGEMIIIVHQKPHLERPRIEPKPLRCQARDQSPESWHGLLSVEENQKMLT
jgi:hypothetical protein